MDWYLTYSVIEMYNSNHIYILYNKLNWNENWVAVMINPVYPALILLFLFQQFLQCKSLKIIALLHIIDIKWWQRFVAIISSSYCSKIIGNAASNYYMSFQRDGKMSNMTWAAYLGKVDQVAWMRFNKKIF